MSVKQNIWRTMSVSETSGVFVWEVMEYVGSKGYSEPWHSDFVQCRDGSWILHMCFHYWTIEKAEEHLNDQLMAEFGSVYHTL